MIQNFFLDIDKQEAYTGQEPVSLADAKSHLRVDFTDDDALISALISAARMALENYCNISLVLKTLTATTKAKETQQSLFAQPYQVREEFNEFELPYGPVIAVLNVTSIDSDGMTVLDCTLNQDYYLTGVSFKTIRITSQFTNNIIVYTTGYSILPKPLWLAILNEVSYRYEARGDSQNIRATAFTEQGVCVAARVLADPYKRLNWI